MATTKVSLKLLVDTKAKRVLFAEAEKDFVDFLLNLLHLPVGTVVRLLIKQSMVGTLGNFYRSIENLSDTYLQPNQTKQSVLKPKAPISCSSDVPLLLLDDTSGVNAAKSFYSCPTIVNYQQSHGYVTDDSRALCPQCHVPLSRVVAYVAPAVNKEVAAAAAGVGGFVRGMVTYMVMDDLVVTPMSTISIVTLLNKFNVKEVGVLEERVVDLGMDEGLKLLKASLQSSAVLTSVFLGKMEA